MARELRGGLDAHGLRIGVLVAQFNEVVTSRLLGGAREALAHHVGHVDVGGDGHVLVVGDLVALVVHLEPTKFVIIRIFKT